MKITKEELLHIARISKIAVHEDEVDSFLKQLTDVLTYAASVKEIAKDLPEIASYRKSNVYRQDNAHTFSSKTILEQAPQSESNYFVVPKILDAK